MQGIEKCVELSVWARAHGLTPWSARQMMSFGSLLAALDPVKIGRHWSVLQREGDRLRTVLYARVSSADQRADLDRQKPRLLEYAQHHRVQADEVVVEAGSGFGGSRRKLLGALSKPGLGIVLVQHRDRLARFGFELVDALLRARGSGVLVVEELRSMTIAACRSACWRSAESGEQARGSRGSCRGEFVRTGLMDLGAISSVGLPLARPAVGCSTVEVAAVTVVGVLT